MAAAVTDQHTPEEVAGCCIVIVLTPIGQREELPDFGVDQPVFRTPPLDVDQLMAQIMEWESRADLTAIGFMDTIDPAVQHVLASIRPVEEGGDASAHREFL